MSPEIPPFSYSKGDSKMQKSITLNPSLTEPSPPFEYIPLTLPEAANQSNWLPAAFAFVNVDLGKEYASFVGQWIDWEMSNLEAKKSSRLKSTFRPPELENWIRKQRYTKPKNTVILKPERVQAFADHVWAYWCALQPSWRTMAANGRMPLISTTYGKDWMPLNHYGMNGWLSLLACLQWWGVGLGHFHGEEGKTLRDDWLAAIADMSWMLSGLQSHIGKQG